MAKIVIDARESGTSTGRYIDKLIEYLYNPKPKHQIVVLTKDKRLDFFKKVAPKFECINSPFKEFTFGEQLGLKKQIESLNADLVHFGMVQQPVLYTGKVVTTIHDLTTLRFNNPEKNLAVFKTKQQIYRRVVKRAAKRSGAIITPSEFVKEDLVKLTEVNPEKLYVTYEAADKITDLPEPLDNLAGQEFLMYVGRPTPHKNLERLVVAFSELLKSHPDLYLVLAGKKDSNYRGIEDFVVSKDLKNVIFTGFISEGQLRWLYENCAVYVFPSLSEGFGLPGLEAMVHGAPVASSSATCLPEIYGQAAKYFNPKDPIEMAEVIREVLDSHSTRTKLIKLGYEQVAKYSWQQMAKQTLDIYDKVLSS